MKFKIPIIWQMEDIIEVEAETIEDAIEKAFSIVPENGKFVKNSINLDYENPFEIVD